jgi:ElaB/YqjD/DUF883 family membrane-anchored ribosome-binding protein
MDTQTAKDQLVRDFNEVIADTEQLLKSVAAAGGEKGSALRASVEQNLKSAKEQLRKFEETAIERTRATARATDQYVHANPWQSIAIASGLAAIVGIVVGLLLNRR